MGKVVVLGSWAANARLNSFRTSRDFDGIVKYEDAMSLVRSINELETPKAFYPVNGGKKIIAHCSNGFPVELEIAWEGSLSEELMNMVLSDSKTMYQGNDGFNDRYIPSLDVLYMLKLSHRYLKNSPHFLKTLRDIKYFEMAGAKFPEEYRSWFIRREAETYAYKHPSLKQDKKSFFNDSVPYFYDHDSIHMAVKLYDKPAYQYFSRDGEEVSSDPEKFFKLDKKIQLAAGYEESCVLAIERSLVPHSGAKTTKEAFDFALMKVCTSITSGWFREFCYNHYDDIQALHSFEPDYFDKFKLALDNGVVQLHKT